MEVCFALHTGKLDLAECLGHKFLDPEKERQGRETLLPLGMLLGEQQVFPESGISFCCEANNILYQKVDSAIALSCFNQL